MATKKVWSDNDNVKLIKPVKENVILWDMFRTMTDSGEYTINYF